MSQIFAPWVRYNNQRVPIALGTGPIVDGYKNQHLWFTDKFSIQCVRDGVIHHYGDALPFDINGRLVVSTNDVYSWDQAVPFTALGSVAIKDVAVDFIDQGVGFTESGHMAAYIDTIIIPGEEWFKEFEEPPPSQTFPIEAFQLDPQTTCISVQLVIQLKVPWESIGNFHRFFEYENDTGDRFRPEKSLGGGSWSIPADLSGAFESQLYFADTPVEGDTFDFRWTLKPAGDPTGSGFRGWLDQVDPQSNATPTEFDNPLTHVEWRAAHNFNLIALRINHTCDITDAEILAWPNYNPRPPTWAAIPPQFNYDTDLPDTFDTSPYASSFNGPVVNYSLTAPPTGYTIDSVTGIITAAVGANVGVNNLTVNAENDTGAPGSDGTLEWTVEAGVVPVWSVIPPQQTRQNDLPTNLDVSGYVSSPTSPITGYSLGVALPGFSINASGVITVAAGTSTGSNPVIVVAENATGSANSALMFWEILEALLVPEWSTIPNQDDYRDELPLPLDASLDVTSNSGPLVNWSLSPVITGFSIDSDGLITATQSAAEDVHFMAVTVTNDSGPATSDEFSWTVDVFRLPPQWETIPPRSDREQLLPVYYDVSGYVTSNDGALTGWALNPPVAGFTIDGAGVITAEDTLTPAPYPLTVSVDNNQGTETQGFTWTIQEELLAPVWDVIPEQNDRENTLPRSFEASLYVDSNDGQGLFAWTLIAAPTGFSISQTGRVTCAAGTTVAAHTMSVRVSNVTGTTTSAVFTWNVLEELLVPQWSTIPNQSDDEDTLPQYLDTSVYVTSNSGPLDTWLLVNAPTGFLIDQSGEVACAAGTTPGAHAVTVRVSNDTGTASKTFTWTVVSVGPVEYLNDFNADLGVHAFQRLSVASGYDDTPFRVYVATGVPVYPLNPFSGTVFTPSPGDGGVDWLGLWIERAATNLAEDSTDHFKTPPWTAFETSVVDSGDPNTLRRTTDGVAMVGQALTQASAEVTYAVDVNEHPSFPGLLYFLSCDFIQTQLEFFNAEADIHRKKATLTLANPIPAVGFTRTVADERLHINNSQLEYGGNWTSFIKTTTIPVTRAHVECVATFANMGLDPAALNQTHCGQIKFQVAMDTVFADSAVVMFYASDSGQDHVWMAFLSTGELYIEFKVQNVTYPYVSTTITAPVRADQHDIRWLFGASEIRVWFNAEEQFTTIASPTFGGTFNEHWIGAGAVSANIVVERIRMNSTDPGIAVIEAWT